MTEDVEALCQRVVVLDDGAVTFDGTPVARRQSPPTGCGSQIARPEPPWCRGAPATVAIAWSVSRPPGAEVLAPTVQDGYLLLNGGVPEGVPA